MYKWGDFINKICVNAYSYIGRHIAKNQDNCFINGHYNIKSLDLYKYESFEELPTVVGLFDGMGGLDKGEIASLSCSKLLTLLYENVQKSDFNEEKLHSFYIKANELLCSYQKKNLINFGSTAVILIINSDKIIVSNIGDSRIYLLKDNSLIQLSQDHNDSILSNSKFAEGLSQYMGYDNSEFMIEPYINSIENNLFYDEKILLCSDGLYKFLTNEEIISVLNSDSNDVSKELVDKAVKNGSNDNITAIVIQKSKERE